MRILWYLILMVHCGLWLLLLFPCRFSHVTDFSLLSLLLSMRASLFSHSCLQIQHRHHHSHHHYWSLRYVTSLYSPSTSDSNFPGNKFILLASKKKLKNGQDQGQTFTGGGRLREGLLISEAYRSPRMSWWPHSPEELWVVLNRINPACLADSKYCVIGSSFAWSQFPNAGICPLLLHSYQHTEHHKKLRR